MIVCQSCNTQNRDTARFCHNCSALLVSELPVLPGLICSNCGKSNLSSAKFCTGCGTPLIGQTPQVGLTGLLAPNSILAGRYTVIRKLGRGGFGAVYLAVDSRLSGKQWAVKELSGAAQLNLADRHKAVEAFKHEATMLASLHHPNLTKVVDYFEDNGKHYLVMDYVEGDTLTDLVDGRSTPFPEQQVLEWAEQLCNVLYYLHNRAEPIIFRDLKPANIMLGRDGRLRLIDFGIARLFKPGKSRDTSSFGTPGYAPAEQYGRVQTDARSDIYALGATLHQLLTLRDPADEPFKFTQVTDLNPSVSQQTNDVVMKAVQPEVRDRWQSALEMSQALKGAIPVVYSPTKPAIAPTQVVTPATIPAPVPVNPTLIQTPVYSPSPALSAPAHPAVQPVGLWVYVLAIVILGAVEGGLGLLINNTGLWEYAAGQVIGTMIYIVPPLLALVFTKRPGAALLTYVLGRLIAGKISSVLGFVLLIPIGAAFELLFIFFRYKRFDVQFLLLSALLADTVAYGLDTAYGYQPPFSAVMFIMIGDILGAFAVWMLGRVLKRL